MTTNIEYEQVVLEFVFVLKRKTTFKLYNEKLL